MLFLSLPCFGIDKLALHLDSIQAQGWSLQGVKLAVTDLSEDRQQLAASISQLQLPKPYGDLSLVNIGCADFSWQNNQLDCKQGKAAVQSKRWQSPSANFSFHIQEHDSWLKLQDLRIASGKVNIDFLEREQGWTMQITGDDIQLAKLKKLLPMPTVNFKSGKVTLSATISGTGQTPKKLSLLGKLTSITLDTKDGSLATESAKLNVNLDANLERDGWQWRSQLTLPSGSVYVQPVFLDANKQPINLEAQGLWQQDKQKLRVQSATYQHAGAGELTGSATLNIKRKTLETGQLTLTSANLEQLSTVYLKPLLAETAFEGLSIAGQSKMDLQLLHNSLTAVRAVFNQLSIKDEKKRLGLEGGQGEFNWAKNEMFNETSSLFWHKLTLANVPVDAGKIHYMAKLNSIRLLDKATLPLLGGSFDINRFSWLAKPNQEPEVYFEGAINQVSLEQFSKAMDWTPLSGTITGKIPGIQYSNKTISLGGQLQIKAFDGDIKISNLAGSGLFTALPKFYSDIEVNNLDMDQLTGQFKFGGITGKLSGYVRQLYMENWQPVSFYAWFGTPDDDDSKHRISQKAVKNIASIGGGGASDLLSRTVLSAFDTFSYDKIGLGCYLHEGVCQLMGVEASKQGYAIIKGGGLPRIDVIGYNPRVDWQVLVDRLKRLSSSDEVIIK
jgi:hypothetical protein